MSANRSSANGARAPRTDATLESGEVSVAAKDDDAVRYGIRATRPENIATVVAGALSSGQLVGLYEARLGRGGVLADPRSLEAHALLERDGTRGFAPAVIAERAHQVFDAARSWTMGTVRPEWRERLGAALRLDSDVAVRPVSADDAPRFHAILNAFASITELPVVLERSFDNDGGSRVASSEDALRRFLASRIDAMVLDGVLFEKCPELHQPLGRARTSWPPADPRRARLVG